MKSFLLAQAEFTALDRHFASFVADFHPDAAPPDSHTAWQPADWTALAAALLSRNVRNGHICLDLTQAPPEIPRWEIAWPSLQEWRQALALSPAVGRAQALDNQPLVLDERGLLYLRRYWDYEKSLADAITARCPAPRRSSVAASASADRQQDAIQAALQRRFVVISGGPGTGKTTTVLKILQNLVSQPNGENLRIALSAPTGKAAARLQESLRSGPTADSRLPQTASTIHRLLGSRYGSVYFRHDANNPLPVDLVVVDEASMVPLPLMAKLFAALPPAASVILLGDRFQLASVEPGAVLGDIAEAANQSGSPLSGCLVMLERNYRFGNESQIFALCNAVREGDAHQTLKILQGPPPPDVSASPVPAARQLLDALKPRILEGYSSFLQTRDPAEALRNFQKFRVLCALRSGPFGVSDINAGIEEICRRAGLIDGPTGAYAGMPILITSNDYQVRLYNGDIGVLLPHPDNQSLVAWFTGEDGQVRHLPVARLPAHEPAFAMTVHKSQGSEFDRVLLLLPDQPNPVLTRELIYTGVTRAKHHIELWFNDTVLAEAIRRPIQRASGLRHQLAPAAPRPPASQLMLPL